ncbi:invasin domain 3-containing protein [Paenibacillus sp. KS-LC4]|uniref:invasin domain 3-containing protein n=1 Tax=Paenibacillus sp. KS-LC4 TaxID=2979727 RepID=UPI0030D59A7A
MKKWNWNKRWIALFLTAVLLIELSAVRPAQAAGAAVMDQESASYSGNVWVNADYPRFQTFTPAITGYLDAIELSISDIYAGPGYLNIKLYNQTDLGAPLASVQLASFGAGWVTVDFSGTSVYLLKDTMYRMVVSTENAGVSGFGWNLSTSDTYAGGYSTAIGRDFAFRTYMVGDYSLAPALSAVSAGQSSLIADGASGTTVTVQLKDAQGTNLTTAGENVTISSTRGTVSGVTDNGDGTYTATLTASTTAGAATVSATVAGQPVASTASVQFVAGAASTTTSLVEVSDASLTADGVSQTTVSIRLKDMYGNALTSGGEIVTALATAGTVSAVTDNGNGTYTGTLTAPTTVGAGTVSATVGGQALVSTASVQYVVGAASTATSTVEASPATLTADGTSQSTVSIKLKDAQGNTHTSGGAAVTVSATAGTVGSVTDNGDGTYTATLTASTTVGAATVSASVGGQAIASTASVQFIAGAASASASTVEASPLILTADGVSQSTVSIKLKDAQGNTLTSGGAAVTVSATAGTVGSVTDNGDGTYTAMLTAPTTVGTATVSATVGGQPITSTADVQYAAGAASTATSTVEASPATLTADGTSQSTVSIKLKDAQGNTLTSGGAAVTVSATAGTVSSVTDNGDGTYTATLTASTMAGTAIVSARVGGQAIAATASVSFVPGAPSVLTSRIQAMKGELTADGASQTTIRVGLSDARENSIRTGGATVTITATLGTVSAVTDNGDGTYTATLTAPTTLGNAIVSATVNGQTIRMTEEIEFIAGEMNPAQSTVTASAAVVRADGGSVVISVKLMDNFNHPIEGQTVRLQARGGHSVITQPTAVTDAAGIAAFAVSNTTAEDVIYFAQEEESGVELDQTAEVSFVYDQVPTITLLADPSAATFETVTVHATVAAIGEFNQISSIKWAEGSQSISYFAAAGEVISSEFTVRTNGVYTVYALDAAGNAAVTTIHIQNIVPLSSNADLSEWELEGAGREISFPFDPATTNYTVHVDQSTAALKMKLTLLDAYSKAYVNGAQIASGAQTGEYSLATGNNTFEVQVEAQDGTIKKYELNVIRAVPAVTVPNTGGASTTPVASADTPVAIQINEKDVIGVALLKLGTDKNKTISANLDAAAFSNALGSATATEKQNVSISIAAEADLVDIQLSADAVQAFIESASIVTLKTLYGEQRLPMAELFKQRQVGSAATKLRITIGMEKGNAIASLQQEAETGGFQLIGSPIYFKVEAIGASGVNEASSFNRYVESVIYLPANAAFTATTAALWDEKLGLRPVPTSFIVKNGRKLAAIRSLAGGTFVLISKTSNLTDIEKHWAAPEIKNMYSRMIVNGQDGNLFKPDAAITRAEMAALLARALGLPNIGGRTDFRDVSDLSWYSNAVAAVQTYGLMDGYTDGTFRPNAEVSRQEAIVMVVRALKLVGVEGDSTEAAKVDLSVYDDYSKIGKWAKEAMQTAILKGLLKGYGNELQPQKSLTRAETTVLIYRMLMQAGFIQ